MFLRKLWRRKEPTGAATALESGSSRAPAARLGDVWEGLQEIAREEDPRFESRSVVEHYHSGGEGVKDVERWLHIYERRLQPEHRFAFPAGHRRHRGYCLVRRNWPDGLRWDAFHEGSWLRAPLPQAVDEESLVRALDAMLDAGTGGRE